MMTLGSVMTRTGSARNMMMNIEPELKRIGEI
jgi:hypothetical protein